MCSVENGVGEVLRRIAIWRIVTLITSQRVGTPGLGSRLSTYWPTKWPNNWQCSLHTSVDQTPIPCVPVESPGLKPNGMVCEERTLRALKPDRIGLSYKDNKCSDAGTEDLGVLITHETSLWFSLGDAGSTLPGWMPPEASKLLLPLIGASGPCSIKSKCNYMS